jgi:hypothetical protein
VDQPLATSELQEVVAFQREGFASGGSSPSREVQEILSQKGSDPRSLSYFSDKDMTEGGESELEWVNLQLT